jgi:pSer/pThr/pTyr-binding forkhead associated (FHA) protein
MAKLYINEGGKEAVYELFDDSPEVTVGRGASNAVQIADGHASKVHFVLRRVRGRWKLVDLESKNGTRVNGAFQNAHWLAENDTVTVGSVVIRFDAEGEPAGAPPRAAVPVAAPARASAAAVAAPPRGARSAPRRKRDEEYDDEDGEERPRFPPRKTGLSGAVIGLLIVAGAGVLVLIISMLMTGENPNSVARERAGKLRQQMRLEEALQVLEREGVPGESGWETIEKEKEELRFLIAERAKAERYKEAAAWHKQNLERWIATGPSWRPADAISEREAAQRLREFLRLFGDTNLAKTLVNAKDATNQAYQTILRENQDPDRNQKKAWAEWEASIAPDVNSGKLGAAFERLSFALQVERLNLPAAEYTSFELQVQGRQNQLREHARDALRKAIEEGRAAASRGEAAIGRERVKTTLRLLAWPDGELKRLADEAMRNW